MRSAVNGALDAAKTATNTGAGLGASANGISSMLTPYLENQLEHPEGYSQGDQSAMVSAGMAGAGGATSAIAGKATQMAAQSRNGGGMQAVLDDAARQRAKAAADTAEGIGAKNADVKVQQQSDAAHQLGSVYSTDTNGMLDAMGQVAKDNATAVEADKQGWLQNAEGIISTINGGVNAASGAKAAKLFG